MGCGKSKHDVASDNTVLQHKKSSVNTKAGQENVTETKDQNNNNNVENVSSEVKVNQKEIESVKESGVEANNDVKDEPAEKTNVQEEKEADGEKDDSLKENDQKINDAIVDNAAAAEEEKPAESEKEDVSVKEETLAKEAEDKIEDTNVSTSEGEEKDLKVEEGQ